jgi:hypothetical protein
MSLTGLKGHLLSTSFLSGKVASAAAHDLSPLPRFTTLGPASSLRALLESGVTRLVESTACGVPVDVEQARDLLIASIAAGDGCVAVIVAPWGAPLHLYWRADVEHATRRGARWCLLFNGLSIRVVDAGRPNASRYAEFDLDATTDDPQSAAAFRLVIGGLAGSLDDLIRESDEHGVAVCRSLRDGVLSASSHILSALVHRRRPPASLEAALDQSLTIVYRVLFLLFAESRGLVPLWHPLYRRSYSIDALVATSIRSRDGRGLWDALRAIARLAHSGCKAGDLRVTPFNGRLFSPARTPLAERRDLDDERARLALTALATRPGAHGARERIAYRDLGVEQLGSVYESLLDYRPSADPIGLVPGSGVRKSTGTFYTPQPIAEYLVRATLGPLVKNASATRILRLRVVDPSMGSGAFLVAACHYLAQACETALVNSGEWHSSDVTETDRASIRREVAERCLYGVDINPMAVQLARLSLWLTTLSADRPLTFLDHRLQTGDSLLGAWIESLRRPPVRRQGPDPSDQTTGKLFDQAEVERTLRDVLPVRFSLELTPDDTLEQVRAKERALATLEQRDSELSKWKRVADAWCAAWLYGDGDGVPPTAFNALADHVLTGRSALRQHVAAAYLDRAGAIATSRRLFHWELEFPEVFFDAAGRRPTSSGFDAVIGNPPWEVVRGDAGGRRFHRSSGTFSSAVTGHGNLYQLFAERAIALLHDGGRLGLVLPSGLATDHNAASLRRRLLRDCDVDALVGIDNHRGVFAIHRSVKFLLTTATKGSSTTSIAARLGEADLDSLETRSFSVRLTPAFLQRISGESMAIPELRTATDVSIVERTVTLFPPLSSDAGWSATFGRELNATDDAVHFGAAGLPVIDGKHIEPFRAHTDLTARFISRARARTLLSSAPFERQRLAYRDVASATNKLTLIAAILPAGCVSTHTLFCLRNRFRLADQYFLCGLFNSLVVNYLVRMRVTTHVTTATVERLPIPPPGYSPSSERDIAALARLLSRRFDVNSWVQLNTRVAHLYQLSRGEFQHVLGTFPLLPDEHKQAAYETYEIS